MSEKKRDEQQPPLHSGWLIISTMLLALAFFAFGVLLDGPSSLGQIANSGYVGKILALITILGSAPRTFSQLGQILTVVAVAGSLAVLFVVAIDQIGWGIWGAFLGNGLGGLLGVLIIFLSFKFLGVDWGRDSEDSQA